jgi:hypothetical protein
VAADLLPILWVVPAVLAWWMARTLNAIRLDVQQNGPDETQSPT